MASKVMFTDAPRADVVLAIYDAIALARNDNRFRTEELLYYQLIDLIRSSEEVKYLTKSYAKSRLEQSEKLKSE